jgi:hypothetical protein
VLHHIERPIELLETIRSRWPRSHLVVAQYGPSNFDPQRSSPPRTLVRWNAKALGMALNRAQYSAEVRDISSSFSDTPGLRPLRSLLRRTAIVPSLYRSLRMVDRRLLRPALRIKGKPQYVVLALASPSDETRASTTVRGATPSIPVEFGGDAGQRS